MPSLSPQVSAALERADSTLTGSRKALLRAVIPKYWSLVAFEELQELSSDELLAISERHCKFAAQRRAGQALVRVSSPGNADITLVEIVVDDMPFLFDSLSNILHSDGFTIHLANHPVLWIRRSDAGRLEQARESIPNASLNGHFKAESWMRFELEGQPGHIGNKDLEKRIRTALGDVKTVVNGWEKMRSKAAEIRFGLEKPNLRIQENERRQTCDFLEWIENNNFTFISYIRSKLVSGSNGFPQLQPIANSRIGLKIDASPWQSLTESTHHQAIVRDYLNSRSLLAITKANQLSPVHRNAYLDFIAIKDFDKNGALQGEHHFFGLFTRAAYNSRSLDIPLLATRIRDALDRARFIPGSHNAKMLLQILETFPRDEQFQSSADELFETGMGVLALEERNRVRVFCRIDTFRRFYSFLIYIPRERYSQKIREAIQALIARAVGSKDMSFQIQLTESPLARLQLIVRLEGARAKPIDTCSLEREIERISQSWQELLRAGLSNYCSRRQAGELNERYQKAFSESYIAKIRADLAVIDVLELEKLRQSASGLRVQLLPEADKSPRHVQVRVYFKDQPMALADVQPRLANLGLRLLVEDLYPVHLADEPTLWIQDFRAEIRQKNDIKLDISGPLFEETFVRIHTGECEDDWFNALVLAANINYREAGLLRGFSRYLKQLGIRFGQIYISEILATNGHIAALLVKLFNARFNPKIKNHSKQQEAVDSELLLALEQVASLDADRILRSFRNLILCTLRTNYYQCDADGHPKRIYAFKLLTRKIADAPQPRPKYEIWVHSPQVEAVHLRGDKVARGGLRWSDRPEDFRTEVLGLVKAQMVKNAVIVPVGAKGGFVCRQLPVHGSREEIQQQVVRCYQSFIRAMLDITDNLDGETVVHPPQVVCHDDDDPYLVVAADKGTATFSDIANAIAAEYDFWIGDAFASGGSNGYDHKKMGITARGAWESVKRHFRELGTDIQQEAFTVIGIGDMAGDVFGNGMLLSEHIRLVAAFNHQHIFIDPNPDPKVSFRERSRLFKLPRSSWEDYKLDKLSAGGGIYSRSEKSIKPSKEACEALCIRHKSHAPDDLIRAILKAPVDLLWNGGIGTYVKAAQETDEQVGDRANDALRVNGADLRCRVVGEGGNLGLTQLGRVEYCLNGGHCNTDFIDNAGGVASSDAEVNIKIALNAAVKRGVINPTQRNRLLRDMTDTVKDVVLRNNYLQSQAISMLAAKALDRLGEQAELMRILQRDKVLDRQLEQLPDEEEIQQRRAAGKGLTRPEISTLLSYAKIDLYKALLRSDVPEDPYLSRELEKYFPPRLHKRFGEFIQHHRLRREIICTQITNSLVNRMGTAFARRLNEEMGRSLADIARAYTIARDAFHARPLWGEIESLDNRVPAQLQLDVFMDTRRMLRHVTLWLLNNDQPLDDIQAMVERLSGDVEMLETNALSLMSAPERQRAEERMQSYTQQGVPAETAARITLMKALYTAPDINWLATKRSLPSKKVAEVYFKLADKLDLIWIRRRIEALKADSRWHALARNALRDDLYLRQRRLTDLVLRELKPRKPVDAQLEQWLQAQSHQAHYLTDLIAEMKTTDQADYLGLSVVLRQLGRLAV